MRSLAERLEDILTAIERIEKYVPLGRASFEDDERSQVWMVHHIQIIGEACAKLPKRLMASHPEIPWEDIIGMRNVIVHDYFLVDNEEVWSVVEQDLPHLRIQIKRILEEL